MEKRLLFENQYDMLMDQSKADLDVKILFGKVTHLSEPNIKQVHVFFYTKLRICASTGVSYFFGDLRVKFLISSFF